MELLNVSPVPILPRTMWVVLRALMAAPGGLTRDEVIDAVCPPTMVNETPQQGAHVQRALDTLTRFGLVTSEGDGEPTLSAPKGVDRESFARSLRQTLLGDPDPEASEPQPEDLKRAVAWLLSQSPNKALDQAVADHELPGLFTNDTRWNTFRYWATFLGFGREWPLAGGGLSVDPTSVIDDVLNHPTGSLIEQGRVLEIQRVLLHLRTELPMLAPMLADEDRAVAPALAYALRSLDNAGKIKLEGRADSPSSVTLPACAGAPDDALVSHITIGKAA